MKDTIFTITTLNNSGDKRCVGFYHSMQEAMDAVRLDIGGLCECYYDYLVIDEVKSGIYAMSIQEIWYKWNNKWEFIKEKPKQFKGIINFGIG